MCHRKSVVTSVYLSVIPHAYFQSPFSPREGQRGGDWYVQMSLLGNLVVAEALVQAAKLQRQSFRHCHVTPFPLRVEGGGIYCEEARGLRGDICVLTGVRRSLSGTFQALVQAAKLQRRPFCQDCATSFHRKVRRGVSKLF